MEIVQHYKNITITECFHPTSGELMSYWLTPNEGYIIHDNTLDFEEVDPVTMLPTGNIILGYCEGITSVGRLYDFEVNERDFYAVEKSLGGAKNE